MSDQNNQVLDVSNIINSDFKNLSKPKLIELIEKLLTTVTRQGIALHDATQKNEGYVQKIEHLEVLLKNMAVPSGSSGILIAGDDEAIAMEQLSILKGRVQGRAMTLEEAKIYEILVRNKKVAHEANKDIIEGSYKSLTAAPNNEESRLLSLASAKPKDPRLAEKDDE